RRDADASGDATAGAEELLLAVDAAARGRVTSVALAGGAQWIVSPASTQAPTPTPPTPLMPTPPTPAPALTPAPRGDAHAPAVTMHSPGWVAAPALAAFAPYTAAIVVAPTDPRLISELLAASSRLAHAVRIAVPAGIAVPDPRVIAIDVTDERSAEAG